MSIELNDEERIRLAQLVMNIFEEWQLEPDEQLMLLGMPESTSPRLLSQFRHGKPLPQDDAVINRAKHVLGIQHSLHVVYPRNHNMPLFWLKHRCRALKAPPLLVMLEEGLPGMSRVWRHLDCTQNWT